MITEDYVSFETAKLLKDKGFDECTSITYFIGDDKPRGCVVGEMIHHPKAKEDMHLIDCPTLQMAMKWLREVHKLDIDVSIEYFSIEYKNSKKVYYYSVLKKTAIRDIDCLHSETGFDSYEQAAEAAIKYCLENLI